MTGSDLLYRWPSAARFGRVVPKTKFYEHAKVSNTLRERFISDVQRITWAYKLADATIHLRGDDEVPEIQVFEIDAKNDDVGDSVLAAIDRSVPFPLLFEVSRMRGDAAETKMVGGYKRLGGAKARVDGYFATSWLPAGTDRTPLPHALDLAGLYAGLLAPLLPVAPWRGEPLSQTTERVEQVSRLQRQVAALERRLRAEPQLNRKMELRRQITSLNHELTALLDPTPSTPEDALWTS